MMKLSENKSLDLDRTLNVRILLRALLVIVLVVLAAEGAARLPGVQQRVTQSLGNYHYQFEIKWFQLQEYIEQHGGVDVILLGSSLVNSGLDPAAINQSWTEQSGEPPLLIYNFGVEGLTIQPNALVAELLIETYQPQVVVFGTEIRDYAANNGVEVAQNFLSDSWVAYQQGQFSLRGWLAEHSAAYRIYLAYRNWMTWDFAENHSVVVSRSDKLTPEGYDVENNVTDIADSPPDPHDPEDAAAFEVFAEFTMDEQRLNILQDLLAYDQREDTQILLLEMPVSPTFYGYFKRGLAERENFVAVVSEIAAENGVPFLEAIPEEDLPPDSRSDRVHLNKTGAAYFSEVVGRWLAGLYADGALEVQP